MHNNNSVINNNYGRLQDLICLLKILMGTRKYYLEIHRQLGLFPSQRFASPDLGPNIRGLFAGSVLAYVLSDGGTPQETEL